MGGYDYRTMFNYPWSQEPCYPPPYAYGHEEFEQPSELEEVMPDTAVPEIFDNSQKAPPRRISTPTKSITRKPTQALDRRAEVIKPSPRMLMR
jgi:hypothetical protein